MASDVVVEALSLKLHGTAAIQADGHLTIGGVDTVALARTYGTPLWVIDERHFRENCRTYRRAFGPGLFPAGAEVVYASKALLTFAVCRLAAQEGLSLDVVSGGELDAAIATGFPLEKVFFHGNNKTPAEIAEALQGGVGRFVIDNLHEIELIEQTCADAGRPEAARRGGKDTRRACVLVRVNPGVEAGNHSYVKTATNDSKFGLSIAAGQALEAVRRVLASPYLELRGLHCHLGSQILEPAPYERAVEILMDFAARVREETGWVPAELSLGGGFGVRYAEGDEPPSASTFAETMARALTAKAAELGLPVPRFIVEPGRAIAATAGWTLYTIGSIKSIPGVRTYAAVDGGMADNPRPALYQARHEACLANRALDKPTSVVTIAGRCCESGDILIRDLPLPDPRPGDILAVSCTGAYNYTMSMNYNRLPRPAMVLVNEGRADIILRRETYADLARLEIVPERLRLRTAGGAAEAARLTE